jgi:hypothetical protein
MLSAIKRDEMTRFPLKDWQGKEVIKSLSRQRMKENTNNRV